MKKTYRAMQVTRPGVLELIERATPAPGPGEALIQVEACGICGADAGAIERREPGLKFPRVPGHEVVGLLVHARRRIALSHGPHDGKHRLRTTASRRGCGR